MKSAKNILLLSAYRSTSHAAWADWLLDTFTEFSWHKLELPGRHFRWRIRGNPLSWLNQIPKEIPDLIIATSMVDLATLKGLHPHLANVPCFYYFHENQFAYPTSHKQHESVDPQMVQLYGALAADTVLFNSRFNLTSFLNGVEQLLKKLPDEIPEDIRSTLQNKSYVLPVAINPIKANRHRNKKLILWNHRWEYDKAPELFVAALLKLDKLECDFQLALLGERADKKPAALIEIERLFADKIIFNGRVSRAQYESILAETSVVISTAIHEFQGLSVLEAVSAGAMPIVPDDLCYKEQYSDQCRYSAGDSHELAQKIFDALQNQSPDENISHYYSDTLALQWQQYFDDIFS